MAKVFATPVDKAIQPIAARIDTPPDPALSAFRVHRTIDVTGPAFDVTAARQLVSTLRNLIVNSVGT